MVKGDTTWKQDIVEWGLQCARTRKVPDLELPFSSAEEVRLRPVLVEDREMLIKQLTNNSRLTYREMELEATSML